MKQINENIENIKEDSIKLIGLFLFIILITFILTLFMDDLDGDFISKTLESSLLILPSESSSHTHIHRLARSSCFRVLSFSLILYIILLTLRI